MNSDISSGSVQPAVTPISNRRTAVFPMIVLFATATAFAPVIRNGFVDFDDPVNVLNNPHIRQFGIPELRWMFSSFLTGPYQPFTWISLSLDYQLWGGDARGFHLTSLAWHSAAALVWYWVSRRLLRAAVPSAAGYDWSIEAASAASALLFAIHPLRVESVAWVTERRDVLSGFFAICSLATYLRAVTPEVPATMARRSHFACVALYVASLLSKPSTVPLPLVLTVLDIWPLRRLPSEPRRWLSREYRHCWIEKWPYWLASTIAAVLAIYGQSLARTIAPPGTFTALDHFGLSCYSQVFYLTKIAVPIHLSPLYELRLPMSQWRGTFLASAAVVAAITATALIVRHHAPGILATWVCFAALVAPVSGLIKCGVQRAADRYTYLPSLSLSLFIAGIGLWIATSRRATTARRLAVATIAAATLVALGVRTWQQCGIWRDSEALWERVVYLDPRSSYGLAGLANARASAGRLSDASELLSQSIEIGTPLALPYYYLASVRLRMGKLDDVLEPLRESMVRDPEFADSWCLLGQYWERRSDSRAAIAAYQRCVQLQPDHEQAIQRLEGLSGRR